MLKAFGRKWAFEKSVVEPMVNRMHSSGDVFRYCTTNQGATFIDPMQFHSAYVICALCGDDPQSDAVELFRTHSATQIWKLAFEMP